MAKALIHCTTMFGIAVALLSLSIDCKAEPVKLQPGHYGFDWLHPIAARCIKATRQNIGRFGLCSYDSEKHSFGLEYPATSCRPRKGVEYLFYATQTQCKDALLTMKANAP